MAKDDVDIKTRTSLDNWVVVYRTVADVLFSLNELAEGKEIEEEQIVSLQKAVDILLKNIDYRERLDVSKAKDVRELLGILAKMEDEEVIDEKEGEVESEDEEPMVLEEEADEEMESRMPDNLEELVEAYEKALREKEEETRIRLAGEIERKTGMGVEEYIERQKELAKEQIIKLAEEKKADVVPEVEAAGKAEEPKPKIRDALLASGINEADAEKMMATIGEESEKEKVDMQKVRVETRRIVKKSRLDEMETAEIVDLVAEEVATSRLKREADRIATSLISELEENGIRIDKKELAEKVTECWRENKRLEMKEVVEEDVVDMPVAVEVAVRKAEKRVEAAIKEMEPEMGVVRTTALREKIIIKMSEANEGGGAETRMAIKRYAGIVADAYDGPVAKHKLEAMEESKLGAGVFNREFTRVAMYVSLLEKGRVRQRLTEYENLRGEIGGNFGSSDKIEECRVFNETFGALKREPGLINQIGAVRNRIAWAQNWGDRIVGLFKPGGIDNLALDLSQKVVKQPLALFINETTALMAQGKSLWFSLGAASKSLLSTGKVAAGAAVKEGVAAGAAAGAVAAKGLTGAVASLFSGPLAPIVAAVLALAPLIKKGFAKIQDFMKKMGLSLGIKKWARENFGKAGGWLVGAGATLGVFVVGLTGALMSTAAVGVGLITLAVLTPTLLQAVKDNVFNEKSLVSSMVAPVNLGAGEGAFYDSEAKPLVAEMVSCKGSDSNKDLSEKVNSTIKQTDNQWGSKLLPAPSTCTYSDSGCGPTAVSKILIVGNPLLTPPYLVNETGSAYGSIGCEGSTMEEAKATLKKYLTTKVQYDSSTRMCTKKKIAEWICEDKIVMVLANFYLNDSLKLGGHYTLAVKVENGEIYAVDPFFTDGNLMDGQAKAGHVQAIRECIVIDR